MSLGRVFYDSVTSVSQVSVIGSVKVLHIFTSFLTGSISFLEMGVEISNYYYRILSPFNSVSVCFTYLRLCYWVHTCLWLLCFPLELTLLLLQSVLFYLVVYFVLKSINLVLNSHSRFLMLTIHVVYLFPSTYSHFTFVFILKVSLV